MVTTAAFSSSPALAIPAAGTVTTSINVGTSLVVHVDGIETTYTGTVRWIALEPAFTPYYTLTSSERSRLVYLAEITLSTDARDLPAGIPAQVELPQ